MHFTIKCLIALLPGKSVNLIHRVVAVEESSSRGRGCGPEGLVELRGVAGLGLLGHLDNLLGLLLGNETLLLVLGDGLQSPLCALNLSYIRVELEHGTQVDQGVALLGRLGETSLGNANLGLHLVGVDDACKVSVEHAGAGKHEGLLDVRLG